MSKTILILIIILCWSTHSQDTTNNKDAKPKSTNQLKNSVGCSFNNETGFVCNYRRNFQKNAFELILLPYYKKVTYEDIGENRRFIPYNGYFKQGKAVIGVSFIRLVDVGRYFRLLSYVQGLYKIHYKRYNYYELVFNCDPHDLFTVHYNGKEMNHRINIGTGMGGELHLYKFILSFRAGGAVIKQTDPKLFTLGPVIEFGAFYKF